MYVMMLFIAAVVDSLHPFGIVIFVRSVRILPSVFRWSSWAVKLFRNLIVRSPHCRASFRTRFFYRLVGVAPIMSSMVAMALSRRRWLCSFFLTALHSRCSRHLGVSPSGKKVCATPSELSDRSWWRLLPHLLAEDSIPFQVATVLLGEINHLAGLG